MTFSRWIYCKYSRILTDTYLLSNSIPTSRLRTLSQTMTVFSDSLQGVSRFPRAQQFLPRDAMRKRGLCCRPMSVCPSVCLSVTVVYCIQTAEDIVKLFSRLGSPMIPVFWSRAPIPNSRGISSVGAQNTRRWEKLAIFDGNRLLPRKLCEICRWLLRNINRKSWVPDRRVSFSMTLSKS